MGEIADMMLNGTLDGQTGEYIGKAVGYPRTRKKGYYNSMNTSNASKRKGVRKYIKNKGKNIERTIQKFYEKNYPNIDISNEKKCLYISTRYWIEFVKWMKDLN